MSNNLTEDLGQLFERHREMFSDEYGGEPMNVFKVARELVSVMKHTGILQGRAE